MPGFIGMLVLPSVSCFMNHRTTSGEFRSGNQRAKLTFLEEKRHIVFSKARKQTECGHFTVGGYATCVQVKALRYSQIFNPGLRVCSPCTPNIMLFTQ